MYLYSALVYCVVLFLAQYTANLYLFILIETLLYDWLRLIIPSIEIIHFHSR